MRKILSISLPNQMVVKIKDEVKTGKYATASEFIRFLIREWEEDELLKELRQSQKEMKAGKGVILKSLKNLRKINKL
jgi:putative addiction module CopG family antidote